MADARQAAFGAAAVSVATPIAERVRPHVSLIALLSLGHFAIDVMQGALPALLPSVKRQHDLSYTATGTIVLAATLSSSIFGDLADQTARRWMLPVSVLLTGAGLALLGVAPSYPVLLALVLGMGFGAAAFHPAAYRTALWIGALMPIAGLIAAASLPRPRSTA